MKVYRNKNGVRTQLYYGNKNEFQLLSLGTIELCKIGDYQDAIFRAVNGNTVYDSLTSEQKDGLTYGKWYILNKVGKATLDGSENWISVSYGVNSYALAIDNMLLSGTGTQSLVLAISNLYRGISYDNRATSGDNVIYVNNVAESSLYVRNTQYESLNGFKTALNNKNLEVIYYLATPTYTEITDTTLIGQLNDLKKNLQTYKNITNIFTVTAGLEPELEVRYLKDDRVAINSTLASLEARVTLLEG